MKRALLGLFAGLGLVLLVGKHTTPFRKLQIGGEYQTLALVTVGDHPEKQLRTLPIHRDVAPFIKLC